MQTNGVPRSGAEFLRGLSALGRLRIISQCGPSTFEAIVDADPGHVARGYFNAITPAYHWHVRLDRLGWLESADEIHARSGRRVLYFSLKESASDPPFLWIYVHREKDEDFEPERVEAFQRLHAHARSGMPLSVGGESC